MSYMLCWFTNEKITQKHFLKENGFIDLNGPRLITKKEWFYLGQGFLETPCIEAGYWTKNMSQTHPSASNLCYSNKKTVCCLRSEWGN